MQPYDAWYMDEVYIVTVRGERLYLWRAVDQDGDVLDILVQKRKYKGAAVRFFKKLMKEQNALPRKSWQTSCQVTGRREKQSCLLQCIATIVMPIIVPKYYINIREHRGGRCKVSNPPVRHNGSFRFTVKSIIFFVWVGIYLALWTIDFWGASHLKHGSRFRVPVEWESASL